MLCFWVTCIALMSFCLALHHRLPCQERASAGGTAHAYENHFPQPLGKVATDAGNVHAYENHHPLHSVTDKPGASTGRRRLSTSSSTTTIMEPLDAEIVVPGIETPKCFTLVMIAKEARTGAQATTKYIEVYPRGKIKKAMPKHTLRMTECAQITRTLGEHTGPCIVFRPLFAGRRNDYEILIADVRVCDRWFYHLAEGWDGRATVAEGVEMTGVLLEAVSLQDVSDDDEDDFMCEDCGGQCDVVPH